MEGEKTLEKVGSLYLEQPRRGYRYGIDSFLLFDFIKPRQGERIADLGAGCGIISLLLANRWPTVAVTGIELQPELADLASANAARNGLSKRCTIVEGDARGGDSIIRGSSFGRVVSNPPFRSPASGRISPEPQRAIARQELHFSLADFAGTAARLLKGGGVLDFIHLPERISEIFLTLKENCLEPKQLRFVHSFADTGAEMVLISARSDGRPGLKVLPPLVIYNSPGAYTAEAASILDVT